MLPRWTLASMTLLPSLALAQHVNNSSNGTTHVMLGWQSSPNGRGTVDIIWSCVFTMFICCWTVIHLNVPAPPEIDTVYDIWLRRIKWMFISVMAPEVVMICAAGQWTSAKKSYKDMQDILAERENERNPEAKKMLTGSEAGGVGSAATESGILEKANAGKAGSTDVEQADVEAGNIERLSGTNEKNRKKEKKGENFEAWSLRHAFFADMGGFKLRDKDGNVHLIRAWHVNFLVRHRYIELPTITTMDIKDRSKSDSLAKFLACMQIGWLAAQVVARGAQHLETTTLELTTLSFVVCTLGTFLAWLRKPYDVSTFTVIEMPNYSIDDISLVVVRDGQPFDLVRDYAESHESEIVTDEEGNLTPKYTKLTIIDDGRPNWTQEFTDRIRWWRGGQPPQANRIRNDRLPDNGLWTTIGGSIISFSYAAIHVVAWNIPFPTDVERLMWRVMSLGLLGSIFVWWTLDIIQTVTDTLSKSREKPHAPRWRLIVSFGVAIVYGITRAYLIIEAFVALRALPPSAYENVSWSSLFPHI